MGVKVLPRACCCYQRSDCCNKIHASSMIPPWWGSRAPSVIDNNVQIFISAPPHRLRQTIRRTDTAVNHDLIVEEQPWTNLLKPTWSISRALLPPLPPLRHSTSSGPFFTGFHWKNGGGRGGWGGRKITLQRNLEELWAHVERLSLFSGNDLSVYQ